MARQLVAGIDDWTDEVHEDMMRFGLRRTATLFDAQSKYQQVTIIDTPALGRALLLDNLWMTAEREEKSYHELLVHPVMTTAPKIARVLIIGGGDGGTAREVLRYAEVEHVDMVEVDGMVIDACKEHLPTIGSAWDDKRLNVIVGDGAAHVAEAKAGSYDVILVDGADPIGPAAVLFSQGFFRDCARVLSAKGVLATQGASPTVQGDVHVDTIRTMRTVFDTVAPYYGTVCIYPGGAWSWIWASVGGVKPTDIIAERLETISAVTEIYNGDIHRGAFAVPNYVARALKS